MRINAMDGLPSNVTLRTDLAATGQAAPASGFDRREADSAVEAVAAPKPDDAREPQKVEAAVESANKALSARNAQVQFALDPDSGRVLVKLIDVETKKVLRQVPNEQMLQIAKNIDRMKGVGVDHLA